jgi:hypothetical protein
VTTGLGSLGAGRPGPPAPGLKGFHALGDPKRHINPPVSKIRPAIRLTHEGAAAAPQSRRSKRMKFMLMMNCPKTGYEQFGSWPKQDIKANIAFMIQIDKDLRAAEELVYAEGLASPHEAITVRAGKDGAPVTDGAFPESKEYLAGYWIVEVPNVERAYAIAAHVSAAPGIGGAPMNMPIEVRQVMSGPPKEYL